MKKQILIATITYTFLAALQPLSNFILLPVYTSHLSIEDYATLSILTNISTFFTILSGFNIVNAIMAFYSSFKDDKNALNHYIGNVLAFNFYSSVPLLLVAMLCGDFIFKIIFKSPIHFYPAGFLSVFYGLIMNISYGYLYFLKFEKKSTKYAGISIVLFVFNTFLQYYFVAVLNRGASGALLARSITAVLSLIIVACYHYRYLSFKLDYKKYILPSVRFSSALIPAALLGWLTTYGDRFIIERFVNLRLLGIYSFLLTISSLVEMIYIAIGAALQPFIFDHYAANEEKRATTLYKLFIALTVCFGSALLMLGSNLNMIIKKPVFLESVPFMPFMIWGYCCASLSYIFNFQIIYKKGAKVFIYQSLIILPLNIILNLLLIPVLDIWGALIATILTKLTMALHSWYFGEKLMYVGIRWNILLPLSIFLLMATVSVLTGLTGYLSFRISAVIQFLIVCSVILSIYYKDIMAVKNQFQSRFARSDK